MDSKDSKKYSAAERQILKNGIGIQKDTVATVTAYLQTAEQKITDALAATPSDWQAWYLPQLQTTVRSALNEMATQSIGTVNNAAGLAWQNGIDYIDKPLDAIGINIVGLAPQIDVSRLMAMRSFMTDRIQNLSDELINKINAQLGLVAIGAQSPTAAIDDIATLLEKGGRSRANTILRTELGRITEVAKQLRRESSVKAGVQMQKQWRRSGKIHSRISHDAADGQTVDVDKPFLIGGVRLMYPRDPAAPASETVNCGCWTKTVVKGFVPRHPNKKPFSQLELNQSAQKRLVAEGLK